MEEIRNHLESNLAHTEKEYDDIYYHWSNAQEAFKRAKAEFDSLSVSLDKASINVKFYQKLLKELNEHEK
jgi:hypothetical protein